MERIFFIIVSLTCFAMAEEDIGQILSKLRSTEVFQGVENLGFMVSANDHTNDQLVQSSLMNLRTSFWNEIPSCENGIDGDTNWLFVDPNKVSSFLNDNNNNSKNNNNRNNIFGHCKWLFVNSEENQRLLRKLRPEFDSKVFLWKQDNGGLIITEIYSPTATGRVFENVVLQQQQQQQQQHLSMWQRRNNFDGARIVATVVESPPNIFVPFGDPSWTIGQVPTVLREWAKKYNFTCKFITPKKGTYGVRDENGNWDGMMSQLLKKEADIITLISVTQERADLIDFFRVADTSRLALFTKKPDQYSSFSFITMLEVSVWIGGVVCIILFVIVAIAVGFLFRNSSNNNNSNNVNSNNNNNSINNGKFEYLGHGILTVFRCLVDQAEHDLEKDISKRLSMRILLLTILLFGYLGINFISANLTSSMSVLKEPNTINSLEDVESNDYELFIWGGSAVEQDFVTAQPGSVQQRIWQKQISRNEKFRATGLKTLMQNFLASKKGSLLMYDLVMDFWISRNKKIGCGLTKHRINTGATLLTLAARKKFPFFQLLNEQLGRLMETGIAWKGLHIDWASPTMEYTCSTNTAVTDLDSIAIGVDATKYFFFLLATFIALSVLLAGCEFLHFRLG